MGNDDTKSLEQRDWRLPNQPTLNDFHTLSHDVLSRYRARYDHSTLSDEELLVRLVGFESFARELIIATLDEPEHDWSDIYAKAARMARNPSAIVLQQLYERGATESQLRFLVRTRLALHKIYEELRKRFDRRPVGRAYYRTMLMRPGALEELLAALKVDRITSFRPGKESDEDLQGVALEAAVRQLERFRDDIRERIFPEQVNLPHIPVLDPASREQQAVRWNWKDLRAKELKETIVSLLPLFRGEELAAKVHSAIKEHFRKWGASKRRGVEVPLSEDEDHPLPEVEGGDGRSVEEQVHSKWVANVVMQAVKGHWGKKGQSFIHALLEGKNLAEASRAAGISRQTGNKYKLVLQRLLDED
jgi:hypothetical protein